MLRTEGCVASKILAYEISLEQLACASLKWISAMSFCYIEHFSNATDMKFRGRKGILGDFEPSILAIMDKTLPGYSESKIARRDRYVF